MEEIKNVILFVLVGVTVVLFVEVRNINQELKTVQADYTELKEQSNYIDQSTVDGLIELYENFNYATEVYDNNVDLYKDAFMETDNRLTNLEDAVITIIEVLQGAGL